MKQTIQKMLENLLRPQQVSVEARMLRAQMMETWREMRTCGNEILLHAPCGDEQPMMR